MNHFEKEHFEQLAAGKITDQERNQISDHLLECPMCAKRFHSLFALDRESAPLRGRVAKRKPIPLRYIIGVAAVMFMAIAPYFTRPDREPGGLPELPPVTLALQTKAPPFDMRAEVGKANYRAALNHWGEEVTLQDLVRSNDQWHR